MKIKSQINLNFLRNQSICLHLIQTFNTNNNQYNMKMVFNISKTQINNNFNRITLINLKTYNFLIKTELNKQTKTMILIKKKSKKDMLARLMQESDISEETKIMKITTKKDKKQSHLITMTYLRNYSQKKKMDLVSSHSTLVNLTMTLSLHQTRKMYIRKKRMMISIKQSHQEAEEGVDLL